MRYIYKVLARQYDPLGISTSMYEVEREASGAEDGRSALCPSAAAQASIRLNGRGLLWPVHGESWEAK